jgi:serine/threonine protein kinase/class 3 adenylate cyclase
MTPGGYRLLAQLGAGDDGIAYRACEPDTGRPVVVCVLGGARADDSRWRALRRRLRTAALLKHPAAVAVRALGLDDPPYVVLDEPPADDLGAVLAREVPLPATAVTAMARDLIDVLAAAHRLGLVHGRLGPGAIRLTADRAPRIDFTGIDAYAPSAAPADAALEASCRAPELADGGAPDAAADVYALGALLYWLLRGRPFRSDDAPAAGSGPLETFLQRLLADDPVERPAAEEALRHLDALLTPVGETTDRPIASLPDDQLGAATIQDAGGHAPFGVPHLERLGRFRLLEQLGGGGWGMVFRAEDAADGSVVAIKLLHPGVAGRASALRRFRKEARLLAEARNPYVANFIDMNQDGGIHYLVQEFVPGRSLGRLIAERKRLDEPLALGILADVARALADAHRRHIIHRDVKPDNILVVSPERPDNGAPTAKLADFGLARHVVESASLNVTGDGAAVGTALYMAPEQAAGRPVGPAADVYALGATLFHMLAGRPPFQADTLIALSRQHAEEPPPPLSSLNASVSPATCALIDKALAKRPEDRYPDAAALLRDVERVLRGEPTDVAVHPRLPACPPERLVEYDWTWDLDAPPELLWPYVANTDRLNRAVHIPAVQFTTEPEPAGPGLRGDVRRFGRLRAGGITHTWQEHPFEWVEGRRFGVLREYSAGVLKWMASMTELQPRAGGGTRLVHRVRIEPRNWLGRLAAAVEVGFRGHRAVGRVYRRIDDFVSGRLNDAVADPFEAPPRLPAAARRRLEELLPQLVAAGVEPAVAWRFGEFLERAAPQDVARIRPLVLARRLGLDADQVVAACLHGARLGLLLLLWDILCPVCRLPSSIKDTLRALGEHGHCAACDLDFALDFSRAVELIFRAHPQVRDTELRTYCVGGPSHWPHVVAQVRARPGESVELPLSLAEGTYRVGGPQLPRAWDFRVEPGAFLTRWDVNLRAPPRGEPARLRAGGQLLTVTNDHARELLVRVERTVLAEDALTAARAASLALFRELFPAEVLSPGQLVTVSAVSLLVTDVGGRGRPESGGDLYEALGDARAFGVIHAHLRQVEECVRREGGAVVKTVGEGVVAAFSEPLAAVRAGLDLLGRGADPPPRVAVHRGPALAATLNGQLDYFGATVARAERLPQLVGGGEMVLTEPVIADPRVAALLRSRGLAAEVLPGRAPGGLLHRLTPPGPAAG